MKDYSAIIVTPSGYVGTGLQDQVSTITVGVPSDSLVASGILYVVQLITKSLLTDKGSNKFSPSEGSSLQKVKQSAVNQTLIQDLTVELNDLLSKLTEQILEEQEEQNTLEGEMLNSISLDKIDYNPSTTTLSIRINIDLATDSIPIAVTV